MTSIGSSHHENAIAAVREFLISKARNHAVTTYEVTWAVAKKYGSYSGPQDPQFWDLLGVVSSRELDLGRPPLSVLVTHKSGLRECLPGEGFFALMQEKGCYRNNDEATFCELLKSTFEYWPIH